MAIYHCSVQVISRGKGRSCVAAAAYRSVSQLADVRQGLTYDYRRRGDVRETWIQVPSEAPEWMADRQTLWTAVDGAEKRKDNQGLDRLPTVHEGVAVRQMEQRGRETERGNWNRAIREHQTAVVHLQTVREERKKLEQVQQRIVREEAWRKTAGWSVAQREWLRKQEEQARREWTRQDIQNMQRRSQASREQRQPVWQEAQRRVEDAHKALSDAQQHQQRLAWQVEQGQKAQAVIHRDFSGMRGVWARWRGKAGYQAQQTQVETGREAERQRVAVQSQIPQLETLVTQGHKQWEQMQKERQEFMGWVRWLGALVQCAYTPEELQVQRASGEARRVAQSARVQADREPER